MALGSMDYPTSEARSLWYRANSRVAIGLATLLIIGAALRLHQLGTQSLWIDEVETYSRAKASTLSAAQGPSLGFPDPPLHVTFLYYWMRLGNSDELIRLPSVIAGVLTIAVVYLLFASLFDSSVGLMTAFLTALNPYHIWYSQEARMYAFLLLFTTLSTLALRRALVQPSRRRWTAYASWLLLAGLTHQLAVAVALAHLAAVIADRGSRRRLVELTATQAVVGIVLLPLIINYLRGIMTGAVSQGDKAISLLNIGYVFFTQSVGFSLGPSIYELQQGQSLEVIRPYAVHLLVAAFTFAVPFVWGVVQILRDLRTNRTRSTLLLCSLTVPIAVPVMVDWLSAFTLNARYVVAVLPIYLGIIAVGARAFSKPIFRCWVGLFVVVTITSVWNLYRDEKYARENARAAAAYVETVADEETVIIAVSYHKPLQRYMRRPVHPVVVAGATGEIVEGRVIEILGSKNSLVLIELRAWHDDPEGFVASTCDRLLRRLETRVFHGVRVIRYETNSLPIARVDMRDIAMRRSTRVFNEGGPSAGSRKFDRYSVRHSER